MAEKRNSQAKKDQGPNKQRKEVQPREKQVQEFGYNSDQIKQASKDKGSGSKKEFFKGYSSKQSSETAKKMDQGGNKDKESSK